MTAHTHTEFIEGCYRCDLGLDEMASALADVENEIVDLQMQAAEMQATLDRHGYKR